MKDENGQWTIAFWIMSVLAVASFGWTTFCYFNNGDKINDLAAVANHSLTTINESMTSIDKRLSKIEWKLEVK
jgi:hypothetical protein